jgi:hypothetical protein
MIFDVRDLRKNNIHEYLVLFTGDIMPYPVLSALLMSQRYKDTV